MSLPVEKYPEKPIGTKPRLQFVPLLTSCPPSTTVNGMIPPNTQNR